MKIKLDESNTIEITIEGNNFILSQFEDVEIVTIKATVDGKINVLNSNHIEWHEEMTVDDFITTIRDNCLNITNIESENNFPICSECGNVMTEGYCIEGGMFYYCSDECLHKHITEKEWDELYCDDGDSYWTQWE